MLIKIPKLLKKLFNTFFDPAKQSIYPNKCICCGRFLNEGENLCELCAHWIERINRQKRCLVCGLEKQRCRCKYNAYHFAGVVAPFYNAGIAKRAFYKYKLIPKKHYALYFASEMVKTIKSELADIKFDAVCYVPTAIKTVRYKGFDHAGILAHKIGETLNLPVLDDVIIRKKGGKKQHTLSSKERFKNVRGRYGIDKRISGMKILLVDDILTTGATLDECSRQLLFAGAQSVYCVTALITDNDYKISDYAKNIEFMIVDC
ncbi:MAG: ComF family protein [Ruminococcaceae bacterium]|nr:ComF family protein [Oscillospiraceae bacterium]